MVAAASPLFAKPAILAWKAVAMTRHYHGHGYHGGMHYLLARLILMLVDHWLQQRRRVSPQAPPPKPIPAYFQRPGRAHLWPGVKSKLNP
jgi:hypothetical protein